MSMIKTQRMEVEETKSLLKKKHKECMKNADNIFKIEIIRRNQTKFGANGRKLYNVVGRYTLSKNVKITNIKTNQYQCVAEMDIFTLASNSPLSVEVSLKKDNNIYYESNSFPVPQKERLNFVDNGVFCCCGDTHLEMDDYEGQSEYDERKQNNVKSRSNCSILIVEDSIQINNGYICFIFEMNGIDDVEDLVVDKMDEFTGDEGTQWIMCDGCFTWQHVYCLQWTKNEYDLKILNKLHLCPLLCSTILYGINIKSLLSKHLTVIDMIGDIAKYKRNSNVKKYRDIFMKNKSYKEKMNALKKYNQQQLEILSCKVGVNTKYFGKTTSISKILNNEIFEQTSPKLAHFLASIELDGLDKKANLRIAEFGCGNGAITTFIAEAYPNSDIYAFDINGDRICAANKLYGDTYKNITWVNMNALGMEFIQKYVVKNAFKNGFDLVVSNPPFESAIQFIYIASELIKNPNGRLIFLLPDSYFDAQNGRKRLAKMLKFNIETCYHVGAWNYHKTYDKYGNINQMNLPPKRSCDAVWIIQPISGADISHKYHNLQQTNRISVEDRLKHISLHPF